MNFGLYIGLHDPGFYAVAICLLASCKCQFCFIIKINEQISCVQLPPGSRQIQF